jgi:hypothetical protein
MAKYNHIYNGIDVLAGFVPRLFGAFGFCGVVFCSRYVTK